MMSVGGVAKPEPTGINYEQALRLGLVAPPIRVRERDQWQEWAEEREPAEDEPTPWEEATWD